jgi:phosphoadenosine phosphosulfate reductase
MFTPTEIDRLNQQFERESPKALLRWALSMFDDSLAIVTSFQPTGMVALHQLSELNVRPKVFTVDTGLLFPETYELMDIVERRFDLNLVRVQPKMSLAHQTQRHGDQLWQTNTELCCQIRKVEPLDDALKGYGAWITGLRRDQPGRANTRLIQWDKKHQMLKISPLAGWDESTIWAYINAYELPYNTLHDQGYASIGCRPETCTQASIAGGDSRSGRWINTGKTECGIHLHS